jgi:hypothetical protein
MRNFTENNNLQAIQVNEERKIIEDLDKLLKNINFYQSDDKVFDSQEHLIVFSNLNHLKAEELNALIETYSQKSFKNHLNFNNSVQKPILEEIFLRLEQKKFSEVSEFLSFYANHSNPYGVFCGAELEAGLAEIVGSFKFDLRNGSNEISTYFNILNFAYHCNLLTHDLASKSHKVILSALSKLSVEDLIKFGLIYSNFHSIDSRFWLTFSCFLKEIEQVTNPFLLFETALLLFFLKVNEPRIQTKIYKRLSHNFSDMILRFIPETGRWKKERICEEREIFIEILQEKRILYETDFNDGFNIDLAIPFKRIAFEFCGPENRVWPAGGFNKRFLMKKDFLTSRKWQLGIIDQLGDLPRELKKEKLKNYLEKFLNTKI